MATEPAIGTIIKRARERKRWSQEDLAQRLGVSRSAVNAWERDRAYPRNSIGALEEVLGISLTEQPAATAAITPRDDWEAEVLADPDLPDRIKKRLIEDSRAARAAYPGRADTAAG